MDFLASVIFDRLFERFPGVRIASIENGAGFLPDLFRKLKAIGRNTFGYFKQDPVESFRQHVWINPFWEDEVETVVDFMGAQQVIFGSDWPHVEGLPEPLDYLAELADFNPENTRQIMRDNALALNSLRPC